MGDITDSMEVSLSKLQEMVKGREAWHAAVQGVTKNWTQLSNGTTTKQREKGLPQDIPHGLGCGSRGSTACGGGQGTGHITEGD